MKKQMSMMVIGCLFLVPALAQAQLDQTFDRVAQRKDFRIQPQDLRVVDLEFFPDTVREGQRVSFRVTIMNRSHDSGRISFIVRDRDEIISQAWDVNIRPGENRIDFPATNYRFSRAEHCFTLEADMERTRRPIDMAKEFCAQKTYSGWVIGERKAGPLYVEDLDMNPDPATPGQAIQFRLRLRNDGRFFRGDIQIQDRDQVVVQVNNVLVPHGYSEFQFPYTRYSFQRVDHCFTVLVDIERTPYPIDKAREFCAKPVGWTLKP